MFNFNKNKKNLIYFYISNETIKRSNFKTIKIGQIINLEKSLIYGQKISGHFYSRTCRHNRCSKEN